MCKHEHIRGCWILTIISLLLVLGMATGCAFAPVERPMIDASKLLPNRYFQVPQAKLYDLCKITAQSMGYGIALDNPIGGTFQTSLKRVPNAGNANCGTWNSRQITGFSGCVVGVTVKPLGAEKSMVELDVRFATRFQGRNVYGMVTRDETYRCASLGGVENQFFTSLTLLSEHVQKEGVTAKPSPAVTAPTDTKLVEKKETQQKGQTSEAPKTAESEDMRVQKLKSLKVMGLMSESEFQAEKAKITKGQ